MNLIIFCAIFCFPTSLAFQVSFHEVDLIKLQFSYVPSLICTPHQFFYQRGDNFTIHFELRNYTSAVTKAIAVVRRDPGTIRDLYFSLKKPGIIVLELTTEQITIDIELFTKDGCLGETILHGSTMPETAPVKAFTLNDMCLKQNKCVAIINAGRVCRDMKPQPCVSHNRKPLVSTEATLDKRHENLNEIYQMLNATVLPAMETSNSDTPRNNFSLKGAKTFYFRVVIIVSLSAAIVLIPALVIIIFQFCWKTHNSPGLTQILPANANRYYENVAFRDGYQQESNQLEQRASEDPQPSEHHYEEINNY